MAAEVIYNIDITTNNRDVISVSSDNFNHFYIANIDDNGDETSYQRFDNTNLLYANFFMIKLNRYNNPKMIYFIDRLLKRKDIVKIGINFTNGNYQEFILPKKRIVKNGVLENSFESAFIDNEDLCILVSEKNIKYKENLFA